MQAPQQEYLQLFENSRPRLLGIAYRMLGSRADAEDILQEACVRWLAQESTEPESAQAWLTTVTTRLCIDYLRRAHVKRECYAGTWLPEPVDFIDDSEDPVDIAQSLHTAFLLLLEILSPTERAVFLLREVFNYEYRDIGAVLKLSDANCRKLLSRARRKIEDRKPRIEPDRGKQTELVQHFQQAIEQEDLTQFEQVLARDAILYSDHGGKALAARRPIFSRDKIARLLMGLRRKQAHEDQHVELRTVNQGSGLLFYQSGRLHTVMTFLVENGMIRAVYVVRNPDKLRQFSPSV
ncbi:MAG: RNA polymerase sigma factor SigJ [Pseudomonadales bacterium]|nr:RNA polymerase sigma factor SigJ [Pseudomonadales bacterium]